MSALLYDISMRAGGYSIFARTPLLGGRFARTFLLGGMFALGKCLLGGMFARRHVF